MRTARPLGAWCVLASLVQGAAGTSSPSHAQEPEPVTLGLVLAAAQGDTFRMEDARRGAELAVRRANLRGGAGGRVVQLVTREIRGPWGSGSRVIVDLVFEEGVLAFLTSVDGRNAHLALQLAAKSRVPLVAAWASDPTLSEAFVPWFFRVVPDDRRQARAFVQEIYGRRGLERVAVVTAGTFDARLARDAFRESADSAGHSVTFSLAYDEKTPERDSLAAALIAAEIEAVVLLGPPEGSLRTLREIRSSGVTVPVFGGLSLAAAARRVTGPWELGEVVVVDSEGPMTGEGKAFAEAFTAEYGYAPGPAAAFAYDGARVLLASLEHGGASRAGVRESLSAGLHTAGATGDITFDSMGNRIISVKLVSVRDGMPPR